MAEYIIGIAEDSTQDIDRLHREYAVNGMVVRCEDCKHGCGRGRGMYYQFIECGKTAAFHKDVWFCGDGERKEKEK